MIEISRNQADALFAGNDPVPVYLTINGIQQEYRVTQIDSSFSGYEGRKFMVELEKVHLSERVVPLQPKKEKPELKYTELWMADTSNDVMGIMTGRLTHGKLYDVLSSSFFLGSLQFGVVCDKGCTARFSNGWFKPVRLYDEDESELICRDIEFKEGDCIDLRKHTPEQIRHIAKFYKFFNVDTLFNSHVTYNYVIYSGNTGWSGHDLVGLNDKEYTYEDIFYSEEI